MTTQPSPPQSSLLAAHAPLGDSLTAARFGALQRSGPMAVLPILDDTPPTRAFAPPLSSLKLANVKGYGKVEMENRPGAGVAIVPLHIGYVQDQAQNHALCRAGFLGDGQKALFDDACCVQQAQGGYIKGGDEQQWFFVLPLRLRAQALKLRGVVGCGKLWGDIASLNTRYDLPKHGHLEHLICRQRAHLTQYASRFERLPQQRGALFFIRDRFVGLEVAPTPQYFAEVWPALVCFCYGAEALYFERASTPPLLPPTTPAPLTASDLSGLRDALIKRRADAQAQALDLLQPLRDAAFAVKQETSFLDLSLFTLDSDRFAGQVARDGDRMVYASIFAHGPQLPN
jgi:hypothetical protein